MKLVIATPSPFARKARIALIEKGLRHEIVLQNPWQTNIEYLETLGVPPALIPADPALRVAHRQIEALADGICDAVVLIVAERARPPEKQSATWIARQATKIPAALRQLENSLGQKGLFTSHGFGLAEIATACTLGYLDLRYPELVWRPSHPRLAVLAATLEARPSFAVSRPTAQEVRMK